MQKNSLKYPVEFVDGVFGESPVLAGIVQDRKVLLVADNNVVQHVSGLGMRIGAYVHAHGITLAGTPIVMAGGERIKTDNLQSAMRVVTAALESELGPEDFILALGGGALLDVAGWAAAQVRGGVRLIRVPTTPAAMMDAAFADTAALGTPTVKDALRVPSVPAAVLVDLSFAKTVLDGVWRAGLGEAVRLAADRDPKFLPKLVAHAEAYCRRDPAVLAEIVKRTVEVRQKKGGTELGLATAAALQPKSDWKLPHGYAVAIGILVDLYEGVQAGTRDVKLLEVCKEILGKGGALDGARHSKHILPPSLADFW